MKKIVALLMLVVACFALTFAGCETKKNDNTGLADAKSYVKTLYKEISATASDYEVTTVVRISSDSYSVSWSVEIKTDGVEANYVEIVEKEDDPYHVIVKVHQTEDSTIDVEYDLVATIKASDGSTATQVFNLYVPKFQVMTYAEYAAAADDDPLLVEGIITGISAKSKGASYNTLYLNDATYGGYYVYSLAEDKDPITELGLKIGQTLRVSGTKKNYSGTYEIMSASLKVMDETVKPVTPTDLTETYQNAESLKAEDLIGAQASLVTIKGVQITGQDADNGYYKFKLGNLETYIRISSSTCPLSTAEITAFKALHSSSFGCTADVTGVVCVYSGSFYLTPVSSDAISNIKLPERTPAEQVAVEKENLTIAAKITKPGEITLATAGTTYTDVKISWVLETETDCASITEGKLVTTYPDHNTEIKLVATLTLGEGDDAITETKEITTVVRAEEKELTEAEILEQAFALESGDYINGKQVLRGEIVRIDDAYSTQYKNITVTIKVGAENKEIQCFRLKGEGADTLAVGDVITVTGTIKNYNGTVEFDAGCTFSKTLTVEEAQDIVIIERANELEKNESLSGTQVVTGKITEVKTAYSEQYKNITVIIGVGDKTIEVFRLKGEGADTLAVGDVITVTGTIKNYNGTVEFDSGCTFVLVAKGCAHEWGEGAVTTAATCTKKGVRTYTCSKCSDTKTEEIAALGHKDENSDNVCDVCEADLTPATGTLTYDFVNGANISDWSTWDSSYVQRVVSINGVVITFSNANRQDTNQKISDRPVLAAKSGSQSVTVNLGSSAASSVKFNLQQWGTKTFDSIVIEYSNDGETWTKVDTTGTLSGTCSISANVGTASYVRLSVSTTNSKNVQLGISGIEVVIAE